MKILGCIRVKLPGLLLLVALVAVTVMWASILKHHPHGDTSSTSTQFDLDFVRKSLPSQKRQRNHQVEKKRKDAAGKDKFYNMARTTKSLEQLVNNGENMDRAAVETSKDDIDIGRSRNVTTTTKKMIYLPSQKVIDFVAKNPKDCKGKERLLDIILSSTGTELGSQQTRGRNVCHVLPTWEQVTSIYGDRPIVYGLETCGAYRRILSSSENAGREIPPMPRVAGLYHSGTNSLVRLFENNFGMIKYRSKWCVRCGCCCCCCCGCCLLYCVVMPSRTQMLVGRCNL